jgi:arylsulfatase A-like enzyme
MKTPSLLLCFSLAVTLVSHGAEPLTAVATRAPSKPNILILLSDDQGYADYGFVSPKDEVKTPHLDALVKEGTFFPNTLSVCPVCSPSRSGLMTGRYPQRGGDYWFTMEAARSGIPAGARTTAEYLREAGYVTGYIGKVHYDGARPAPGLRTFPTEHGFDHFFGATTGGTIHYLLHSEKVVREKGREYAAKNFIAPLWRNNEPQRELDGFTTDLFADDAVKFIHEHAGKQPFYLHVAWNAVHTFVKQLPPEEAKRRGFQLDEEGNAVAPLRSLYLAQLELLDNGVGRILDALKQAGQLDKTLILYTTDNGGTSGSRNWPLTGGKYHLYEGGVRCPIIARFPGRFAAGSRSDAHVSHLDILPTVLEVAGVSPKPGTLDGTSLFGLAARPEESARRSLFHDTGFQWSVHQGDWKLLVTSDENAAAKLENQYKLKLAHGVNLFDLRADPAEKTNLAAAHPEMVANLTRLHDEWRKECRPPATSAASTEGH